MSVSSLVIFIILQTVTFSRAVVNSTTVITSNRSAECVVIEKSKTDSCKTDKLNLGHHELIKLHENEAPFLDQRNISRNTMINTSFCCTIETNSVPTVLTFASPVCLSSPKIFIYEINVTKENIANIDVKNEQNYKHEYHEDPIYPVGVRNFKNDSVMRDVISTVEQETNSEGNTLNIHKLKETVSEDELDHRTFSIEVKETHTFSSHFEEILDEITESNKNVFKIFSTNSTTKALNNTHMNVVSRHENTGVNSISPKRCINSCISDIDKESMSNSSLIKDVLSLEVESSKKRRNSTFIVDKEKLSTLLSDSCKEFEEKNRTFEKHDLENSHLNDNNLEGIRNNTSTKSFTLSRVVDENVGDELFDVNYGRMSPKIESETIGQAQNSFKNHNIDSTNEIPTESSGHIAESTCADTTPHFYNKKYPLFNAMKLRYFQLNKTEYLNGTSSNNQTSYFKNSMFFKAIQKVLGKVKGNFNKYVQRNSTRFMFRRRRTSFSSVSSVTERNERTKATWDAKKSTKYSKRFLRLLHRRRPDLWAMLQKPSTASILTTVHPSHFMFPDIDEHGSMKWEPVTFTLNRAQRWKHQFESWWFKDQDNDIVPHQEVIAFLTDVYQVVRRTQPSLPPWMFTHSDNTQFIFLRRHGVKSLYSPKRNRKRNPPVTELRTTLSKWQKIGRLVYNYFWTTQGPTTEETHPPLESLVDISHYWPEWKFTRRKSGTTKKRFILRTEGSPVIHYDEWR